MPTLTLNKVTVEMPLRVGFFPSVAANSSLEAPIFRLGARKMVPGAGNCGSEQEKWSLERENCGSEREKWCSEQEIAALSEKIGARSRKIGAWSRKIVARSAAGEVKDMNEY
jgi:hypothetical protein